MFETNINLPNSQVSTCFDSNERREGIQKELNIDKSGTENKNFNNCYSVSANSITLASLNLHT
jgi:hypothetical protein